LVETGSTLYTANGSAVTGFNYVTACTANSPFGIIYNLDPLTGVIGSSTGQNC
jgi:hypothetical protein